MFTGLVEEKGILKEKIPTGDGFQFVIEAKIVMNDLRIGSSVAVNGCCLTVVKIDGNTFAVDTIEETLNKTNLGVLKQGMNVNLERPLLPRQDWVDILFLVISIQQEKWKM